MEQGYKDEILKRQELKILVQKKIHWHKEGFDNFAKSQESSPFLLGKSKMEPILGI